MSSLVLVADGLTLMRLLIAVVVIPVAWTGDLTPTAVLVSVAWLTDLLDGRLARASGVPGRLGTWDLRADTAVGTGLMVGLVGSGLVPAWILALVAMFLLVSVRGSAAGAMLAQLCGYLPLLFLLWTRRPIGWWVPFVAATAIGLVDWRRLVRINIPAFIGGLRLAITAFSGDMGERR